MFGPYLKIRPRTLLAYVAALAIAAGLFLWIGSVGAHLYPSAGPASSAQPPHDISNIHVLPHLLLALAAVLVAALILGALFRHIGQPPVIGEIVAGIALGPSLLGALWPSAAAFLLPAQIDPFLAVIAQIGVILFMFIVGLELDTGHLVKQARVALAVSYAGIVAPFLLGGALAIWLYPSMGIRVPFTVFMLFLGTAMSVTALPVLARILEDLGMANGTLGTTAITCAAVADVLAWCMLAVVVGVAGREPGDCLLTIGLATVYVTVMLTVVRTLVRRLVGRMAVSRPGPAAVAAVFALMLLSAYSTERIGIHPIFGAFLFGVILPHDSALAREIRAGVGMLVTMLFLPVFFVYSGLRTQVGLLDGFGEWMICLAVILVAFLGKFGGSYVAARMAGVGSRDAASLGVLMNARGLVELLVLNIGLDLGIITPKLFTMLVLMALVTTFMTAPVVRAIHSMDRSADRTI